MMFVRKCEKRIRELCASGATILFVSHNMHQVLGLCDRSILIMKGRVAYVGKPEDTFNKYRELYVSQHSDRLRAERETETFRLIDGDGSVRVTDIVFRDKDGNPAQNFFTGGPMTIDLTIERSPECESFYAFIGFLLGNQYVGHIDTENLVAGNDEIRNIPLLPRSRISIKIDSLVMLNGVYSLWIWLMSTKDRRMLAEYRNVAKFMVSKRHHPFDADAFFSQPVVSVESD